MNEFVPRGQCGGWTPQMLVAVDIADALITLAYFVLPALMYLFWMQVRQRPLNAPRGLILWYAAFIFACGGSHLVDVLMTWWPAWHVDVLWHGLTASVSVGALASVLVAIRAEMKRV